MYIENCFSAFQNLVFSVCISLIFSTPMKLVLNKNNTKQKKINNISQIMTLH